jgi:periplasmic divalent cation tolerance protein
MSQTEIAVVLTTVATEDDAVALIGALLERHVVACGTLLPGGRSMYRWEGRLVDEPEVVVLLKTRTALLDDLREAFTTLHPYRVPELLALPVAAGLEKYLGWIASETQRSGDA